MTNEAKIDEILLLLHKYEDYPRLTHEELVFLRHLIEEKKLENQSRRAIYNKIISGGIWAALVATFLACLTSFKQWLITTM